MMNENNVFMIATCYMSDFRKKVKTIENKCRKYGCDFSYKELGNEIVELDNPNYDRFDPTSKKTLPVEHTKVYIDGTAIINDWELIASVEHTPKGNIYHKALIDVEIPHKYRTTNTCLCEHCNTNRQRNWVFIIRNTKTNDFKQIGNTCLKDYTNGMSAKGMAWFASLKSVFADLEEESKEHFHSGIGRGERTFELKDVLLTSANVIRKLGYVKPVYNDYGERDDSIKPTRTIVSDILCVVYGYTNHWQTWQVKEVKQLMENINFSMNDEKNESFMNEALQYLATQSDNNDYIHNLNVVTSLKMCRYNNIGLVCSLYPAMIRDCIRKEEELKRKAKENSTSNYLGNIGDKVEFTISDIGVISSWDTQWGTTYVWKFTSDAGDVITWKTSKWFDLERKEKYIGKTMKATIKGLNEFRGTKQTEITRGKLC